MSLLIFKEKLINSRNKIFLLLIILLHIMLFYLSSLEPFAKKSFLSIISLNLKLFYLWILVSITSQLSSGLFSKQLTNGLSRRKFAKNEITYIIYRCIAFYTLMLILVLPFYLFHSDLNFNFHKLLGFPFIGFLCLSSIAMFMGLLFKSPIKAAFAGYFIYDFDGAFGNLLSKYIDPNWGIIFPHFASSSLFDFANPYIYSAKLLSAIFFTTLFFRLTYKRILNMDFN